MKRVHVADLDRNFGISTRGARRWRNELQLRPQ